MYDHKYHGIVQSVSYASGNTFSLLPAENATGNWVKVTQRFTVRVTLQDDPNFPLRVGASSNVTVDTTK
jgi:membrane fusion protein (multidrug efflux system)